MFRLDFKMINPFSQISRDLVGIDLSTHTLKMSHLRVYPNRKELLNLTYRNISGLSDIEIARLISDCLLEFKANKPYIANIISSNLVITKNIEIPSTNPYEIHQIINLQAGRHTPYSKEEIIVDYIDIGIFKQSYTKVLLVILVRSNLKRQYYLLEKAGLNVEKTFFAAEAFSGLLFKPFQQEAQDAPINLIHIDEIFTDFVIVLKDRPIFIRNIPIGAQHISQEGQRYFSRFIEEAKRSLESYQSEDIERIPKLAILYGAIQDIAQLSSLLSEGLNLPVRIASYYQNLILSERARKVLLETKHLSFLPVIAPLLDWQTLKVDFIPEEIRLKKEIKERAKDLVKTGILSLAVFVLIFFILITKIYFKGAYLSKLNLRYQQLEDEAKKLQGDFAKISLIRNYLANRGYSLEVLMEIYNLLPLELQLDDLRFDLQGRFNLKGTSEKMSSVYSFVDAMEKSRYFKAVKLKYTTKRKEGSKDLTDFEISCLLEKGSD
ncbi:MAG: pilus assembly protein PilM [Candidatus Omnitrophica bacterium]|nr:pilus assembly protein PilM [Candidatus Omnitrophota bacterium]